MQQNCTINTQNNTLKFNRTTQLIHRKTQSSTQNNTINTKNNTIKCNRTTQLNTQKNTIEYTEQHN